MIKGDSGRVSRLNRTREYVKDEEYEDWCYGKNREDNYVDYAGEHKTREQYKKKNKETVDSTARGVLKFAQQRLDRVFYLDKKKLNRDLLHDKTLWANKNFDDDMPSIRYGKSSILKC